MTVSLSTERPVEFDQMATRDWVQVARSFASSIEAARERIEQQRRVPSDLIRAMADAGQLRLATPRVHGGEETSLITLARTIEELSRADGSVGWTVLIGNNDGYHAGYLPEASAAEIFGADASVIVAGSGFARHAVAKPVRGGYQLTGRWGLASGCQEASWFAAAAPILRDSDARPQLGANGAADVQLFFVPKAACTIILGRAETKSAHACQDGERDIVVEAAHTGHAWLGRAPGAYRLGGLYGSSGTVSTTGSGSPRRLQVAFPRGAYRSLPELASDLIDATNVWVRLCASTPTMTMSILPAQYIRLTGRTARGHAYIQAEARLLLNHTERSKVPFGRRVEEKPQANPGQRKNEPTHKAKPS